MSLAVCPGSFDPITRGHLDIVRRASVLFEEVVVLVVINPDKHCAFTIDERCDMIRQATAGIPGVRVDSYYGLLADYVRAAGAAAIVKGLRAMSDFEYEFQMAGMNQLLLPEAETIFLTPSPGYQFVSGTFVREIALLGGDVSKFVSSVVLEAFQKKLSKTSLNAPLAQGPR